MSFFGGTTTSAAPGGAAPFSFGLGNAGAPASTAATGSGGFGFGNPAATTAAAPPAFGFGAAPMPSQPAAAPTAFGFGAPVTGTPAATPSFGFGQTAGAPAATSTPAFGMGLGGVGTTGTAAAPAAPFSFGLAAGASATPQANPAGSLFGATIGQPNTNLAQQPAATGFGFGGTTNTSTFTLPTATTAAPTASTGFAFGQTQPTAATAASSSVPAFGAAGTTTQPSAAQPSLFGTGTGITLPGSTTTTTAGSAFSFGPTATTATPFTTSTSATAAPTTATGFSLGSGLTSSIGTSGIPSSTAATQQQFTGGLGGTFGNSGNTFGMGSGVGLAGNPIGSRIDQESVLELPIPAELLALVEEVKACAKNEKVILADACRASYRSVEQVTATLEETRALLLNTSNTIQRHTHSCETFRQQMNQDMKDAEMAQITRDTPAVLQSENYMPVEFFYRLFSDYENRMVVYKREIRKAESAIAALDSNTALNSRDLCMSLKSVKDSLLVIAAKVKTIHERVNAEVETHKSLLRFVQGDTTGRDGFGERTKDHRARWDPKSEDATAIFPSRIKDPAKLYMNYMATSSATNENNPFANLLGTASHSQSQGFGRNSMTTYTSSRFQQPSYPGYGSATLFQSPCSPILNPLNATSPPHSNAISLKRTKH